MSKKIIISESQYRRVFLNEQKSGDYAIDPTPYGGGGQKREAGIVVDPMTGDKKWDYGTPPPLRLFDKSGNIIPLKLDFVETYNNAYNKLKELKSYANWEGNSVLVDDSWLKKNGSNIGKVLYPESFNSIGVQNTDIYNPDWLLKKHAELSDAAEIDLLTQLKQETFRRKIDSVWEKYRKDYEQYEKDFAVWKGNFEKIVDSDNRFVSMETQKMQWIDYESGSLLPKQNYPIHDFKPKYDLNNPFGRSDNVTNNSNSLSKVNTEWVKPLKPKNVKEFQDWLDIYHPKWMDGGRLDKGPGYGKFGPRTTKAWSEYGYLYQANKDKVIPSAPQPPELPKISSLADRTQSDLSEIESTIDSIWNLLSAINEVNKKLDTQNKNDIGEFCRGTKNKCHVPGGQCYGWIKYQSDSWLDYCSDGHGGVWVYSQGRNSKACGCVSTPNQENIGQGYRFNPKNSLEHKLETTDLRGTFERIGDWVDDCLGDWHCVADVASIAVLFLPIPGVNYALSSAIDLVSGAGYILEGEEGWELNAGLTLLGGVVSGVEAGKFVERSIAGGKTAVKWGQALNDIVEDANKLNLDPNFTKLTKQQQNVKWSQTVKNNISKLSTKELQDLTKAITLFNKDGAELLKGLKDIMSGIKGLSSEQKVGLRNIIRKMEKDPSYVKLVMKEIIDNGGKVDMKKILKKFAPNITKEAIVQSTLFSLLQFFPEETAAVIKGIIKTIDSIPGVDGELSRLLGLKDIDKNDADSKKIIEKLAELENYALIIEDINKILDSENYTDLLLKYDITSKKNIREIIINGKESVIGAALENALVFLEDLISIESTLVDEGKSEEEIKKIIQEKYDAIIDFLEEESKKENLFDLLEKEASPWSPEEKEKMEEEGWDIDFFN